MKKKILLLMGVFAFGLLQAQVGINTQNPQGWFHVDGQGNTNGAVNMTDDVLVNNAGNVGLGTTNPQAKLHVEGNIRYQNGALPSVSGLILQTDDNGLAYWAEPRAGNPIYANGLNGPFIGPTLIALDQTWNATTAYQYMGISISIPPGRWMLTMMGTYYIAGPANVVTPPLNFKFDLCQGTTTVKGVSAGVITSTPIGGLAGGGTPYSPVSGNYIVHNTTAANITYFLWIASTVVHTEGFKYSAEGYLWGIPFGS